MENGIEVYVIRRPRKSWCAWSRRSKYGYNVKPQNVIGVSLLLKDRATGELTTARKQISAGSMTPRPTSAWN
jgi:hypothetical protein